MALKTIRLRRGTDAERQTVTPLDGEGVWTTDLKELWIGDGITVGGIKVGAYVHPDTHHDSIITHDSIGNPTYNTLDKAYGITQSAGIITGCDLTNNLDGTVSISAGEGLLHVSSDPLSNIVVVGVSAQANIAIPDNTVSYIYLDYNLGSPQFVVTQNQNDINCIDKCLTYILHRTGTELSYIDDRQHSLDVSRKTRKVIRSFSRFVHTEGGTRISEPASLALAVSAGSFFYTVTEISHPAYDTNVAGTANENVFILTYRDGLGGWTEVVDTKLIDTNTYDNGTGTLATISNNKFGVDWIYILHNNPSKLYVLKGQAEYATQADADSATPPNIEPEWLSKMGSLIGFVTYQKGGTSFTKIFSAFDYTFSSNYATNHNDLAGIQGGTANDYQHLTSTQLDKLINLGIEDLSDVNTMTPLNGQVLTWDDANQRWDATTPASGVTDHTLLTNIGTNTHAQIDTHIGDTTKHRVINDAGSTTIDLWSASKIISELATKEPADATILKESDIGVSIQAYNINTVIDANYVHTDNNYTTTEKNKLAGIEDGATADQTPLEIKTAYESNANTNAYTDAEKTKVGHITITQAVDLDAIETRVNQLDASVVLMGTFNASAGTFPTSTNAGESWIVTTAGTIDGVDFAVNDRIVAIVAGASTTIYANNWHKLDYTDAVLSVAGRTGAVTLDKTDVGLGNVQNVDTTNADNINDGVTKAIITKVQETNFETAYTHSQEPHAPSNADNTALNETSHADVLVDGDFVSQGIMLRGATAGSYSILTDNSTNWNTAYTWGDHALAGYLTSSDIADVLVDGDFTVNGLMKRTGAGTYATITDNSANWDTAYSWGNHALVGYLTSESDPVFTAHTVSNISNGVGFLKNNGTGTWSYDNNTYSLSSHNHDGVYEPVLGFTPENVVNKRTSVQGWQVTPDDTKYPTEKLVKDSLDGKSDTSHNHTGVYEPVFTKNTAFNKNFGVNAGEVAQGNDSRINNGQTAFGWGDHALVGYLTGITGQSIKNLSDVNSTMTPTDGQVLTWDNLNSRWTALDPTGGGAKTVDNQYATTVDQTAFTTTYNVDALDVYIEGAFVNPNQYTATNGTSVTFHKGVDKGTWVMFVSNDDTGPAYSTSWSNITNTPTTMSGYGITDGASLGGLNVWTAKQTFNAGADLNNTVLEGTKLVTFNGIFDNGTKTANWTMTLANGQYQKVVLGANTTLSITPPAEPCTVYLHIYQDATGSRTLTLPSGEWVGGTAKAVTATASAHDLLMIHFLGGTSYVFEMMQDLSVPA